MRAIFLLVLISLVTVTVALAEDCDCCNKHKRPYGQYCQGPRWGWYGAKNPVAKAEDARKILEEYFRKQDLRVGEITEKPMFFRAEILNGESRVVDLVIVDKRNGRIRSIK